MKNIQTRCPAKQSTIQKHIENTRQSGEAAGLSNAEIESQIADFLNAKIDLEMRISEGRANTWVTECRIALAERKQYRVAITIAESAALNIGNAVEDNRMDSTDSQWPTYQSLASKLGKNRKMVLTSADEIRTVYAELIGSVVICDDNLAVCEAGEERDLNLERGTLKRSADRLAQIMTSEKIDFVDEMADWEDDD